MKFQPPSVCEINDIVVILGFKYIYTHFQTKGPGFAGVPSLLVSCLGIRYPGNDYNLYNGSADKRPSAKGRKVESSLQLLCRAEQIGQYFNLASDQTVEAMNFYRSVKFYKECRHGVNCLVRYSEKKFTQSLQ